MPAPDRPFVALLEVAGDSEQWEHVFDQLMVRNVTQPALYPVLPDPELDRGKAVIVAPGGAFHFVSLENEGFPVAERLATTVVALQDGRVIRQGPAAEVLGDPSVAPTGVRGVGAVLEARVAAHHADGLSELDAAGDRLFLPRVPQPVGAALRIRIAAQEVMLSLQAPQGISALNILPGAVEAIHDGQGPGTIVSVRTRAGVVLARVTRRSAEALALAPGLPVHAIVKTVAIAPEDVGGEAPPARQEPPR